mgnify:CR=1 FL=1
MEALSNPRLCELLCKTCVKIAESNLVQQGRFRATQIEQGARRTYLFRHAVQSMQVVAMLLARINQLGLLDLLARGNPFPELMLVLVGQ